MELTIRRLGVLSLGKIMGALYAFFGLIFGAIFSLISMFGFAAGMAAGNGGGEQVFASLFFGVGAIIALPIFYGVLGFLGGLLTALVFNLVAGWVGGLEIEADGAAGGPEVAGAGGSPSAPTPPSYG